MKKRAVAIILAAGIIVGLLSACKKEGLAPTNCVTRGEWLSMLVDGFDLDHITGGTPYYEDIHEGNPWFEAVQTAGAWNILAPFSGSKLNADQPITREEAAATAAIAAGFRVSEDFEVGQAAAFAADRGILTLDGQKYVTVSEGETALEAAKEVYLNDPGEERINVVLNPNLIDLRELAPAEIHSEDGRLIYPSGVGSVSTDESGQTVASLPWGGEQVALRVGDTFISPPTAQFPAGVAYKVAAIYDTGGAVVLDVQQPAIEDLYETLDVHTTVSANLNDIVWAEGVSAAGQDGEYTISLLSSVEKDSYFFDKTFDLDGGDYRRNWTKQNSPSLGNSAEAAAFNKSNFVYTDTPSLSDFGGGTASWEKKLFTENKFSAGYKITGRVTISDITITPDIQFSKSLLIPLTSAAITVKADMSASLELEGNLNERLKIGSAPVPLGLTATVLGLTATVDIYLYVDASGSIQAEAQLDYHFKAEWASGAGLRKSQGCDMTTELGVEADIGFGGDVSVALHAFGCNIIDAGARAGGEITAEAKVVGSCDQTLKDGVTTLTYKESMKVNATLYAPIVTLYVGSEDSFLKDILGVGVEWELLTKENTQSWPLFDQEWVFWEQTVTLDEDGNTIDEGTVPLSGNTYTVQWSQKYGNGEPPLCFSYPEGWTITTEELNENSEYVVLKNERGIEVIYQYMTFGFADTGMTMNYQWESDISQVAESSLEFDDQYGQGPLMVAKVVPTRSSYFNYNRDEEEITERSSDNFFYAVIPEEQAGFVWRGTYGEDSFMRNNGYVQFLAYGANSFTDQETQEVIEILSSLRIGENAASSGVTTDPTLMALQSGDFSEFAGTYAVDEQFRAEWYWHDRDISDFALSRNGESDGGWFLENNGFTGKKPFGVTLLDDGSYWCAISESMYSQSDGSLLDHAITTESFTIYPPGVPYYPGSKEDTSAARIRVEVAYGGILYIYYTKID